MRDLVDLFGPGASHSSWYVVKRDDCVIAIDSVEKAGVTIQHQVSVYVQDGDDLKTFVRVICGSREEAALVHYLISSARISAVEKERLSYFGGDWQGVPEIVKWTGGLLLSCIDSGQEYVRNFLGQYAMLLPGVNEHAGFFVWKLHCGHFQLTQAVRSKKEPTIRHIYGYSGCIDSEAAAWEKADEVAQATRSHKTAAELLTDFANVKCDQSPRERKTAVKQTPTSIRSNLFGRR